MNEQPKVFRPRKNVRRWKIKNSDILGKFVGDYLQDAKGKDIEEVRSIYSIYERKWISHCRKNNAKPNRYLDLDQTAFEKTVENKLPGEIDRLQLTPSLKEKYLNAVRPFQDTPPLFRALRWIQKKFSSK